MNQNVSSPDAAAASLPPYTVETWPIGKPQKYERNARTHSAKQLAQLRDSFRKFGQVWPILVREDGTIIAGHGRLEAAKAEGMTDIRVIVATGWSEEQCRAFGLLDNRVALNSDWDETLLAAELAELSGMGVDLSMLGFAAPELSKLLPNGGGGLPTRMMSPTHQRSPPRAWVICGCSGGIGCCAATRRKRRTWRGY